MSLSDTEKAQLAEILALPSPDLVASELSQVTTAQETILRADIAKFQTIRSNYGSLNGTGKSGVEFDPAQERGDIKNRIIRQLNCGQTVRRYAAWNGAANIAQRA